MQRQLLPDAGSCVEGNWNHLRVASSRLCLDRLSAFGWFVVLGVLLCVVIRPAAAGEPPPVKNVLILHNWANLPQSWALMESTVRARVPGQINFYTASVENPRFDEEALSGQPGRDSSPRVRWGKAGSCDCGDLSGTSIRGAIPRHDVSGSADRLYRCQLASKTQNMWPGVTGVISPIGMRETIDLALQLQSRYKCGRNHHRRIGVGQVLVGSCALRTSSSSG